jgi:hypothetical protein
MQVQQSKPKKISSKVPSSAEQQAACMVTVVKGKAIVSAKKVDKSTPVRKPVVQTQTFDFVGIAG